MRQLITLLDNIFKLKRMLRKYGGKNSLENVCQELSPLLDSAADSKIDSYPRFTFELTAQLLRSETLGYR